jgi:Holliday junction resolvasome RuvABC endonuclease subunit
MIAILGIDTGFTATGLALVGWDGETATVLDHATITTAPTAKKRRLLVVDDHLRRIREINAALQVPMCRAQIVVLEAFSQARNAAAAVRQAFGYAVAVTCAQRMTLPVVQFTPQQIRKRLGLTHNADKVVLEAAGAALALGPWDKMTEHEADAACAALAALFPDAVDVVRAAAGRAT